MVGLVNDGVERGRGGGEAAGRVGEGLEREAYRGFPLVIVIVQG